MDLLQLRADEFISNSINILELLKQNEHWRRLPMLNSIDNLTALNDGQLVRFRGLVQDMLDPEIYLEKFETCLPDDTKQLKCSKYRDNINLAVSLSDCQSSDWIFICAFVRDRRASVF